MTAKVNLKGELDEWMEKRFRAKGTAAWGYGGKNKIGQGVCRETGRKVLSRDDAGKEERQHSREKNLSIL